jgi:hypothetical protein
MRAVLRHPIRTADSRDATHIFGIGGGSLGKRARRAILSLAGSYILAAGAVIALPAAASAASLSCGSTIKTSITLTSDLNCTNQSSGNALTIGAAGVDVNLNGYQIAGPGASSSTEGIVDDGHNYPTIEDGTISGFTQGIDIEGATNPTKDVKGALVRGMTIIGNGTGISLNSITDCYVMNNHVEVASGGPDAIADSFGTADILSHNYVKVSATGTGFDVNGTTNEVIRQNIVVGTGEQGGIGIVDYYSSGQVTTQNILNDLGTGIFESDEDGAVNYNTGYRDGYGIDEEGAIGIRYFGNHFNWGHYGIWLYDPSGTRLTGNVTDHNSKAGVYVYVDYIYCSHQQPSLCAATLNNNTADYNARGLYSQIRTGGNDNHAAYNAIVNCHNVTCVNTTTSGIATSAAQVVRPPIAFIPPAMTPSRV